MKGTEVSRVCLPFRNCFSIFAANLQKQSWLLSARKSILQNYKKVDSLIRRVIEGITDCYAKYIGKIEKVLVRDDEYKSNTIPTTEVEGDIVEIFPKPNAKLNSLIQIVPITRLVLFQYKRLQSMTEEWKSWAWEMMEKGFQTPSIIQLAGESMNLNQFEFASLIESILKELELEVTTDEAYYQYVLYMAHQVLDGVIPAEEGFKILTQLAIDTDYHNAFMEFYYLEDNADLLRNNYPGCYGDGNMREDNIEEWMHLYFEKVIKFNE
jgi:hypothetical protein